MEVSVCMITYNHEKYIKQAIENILCQKTNFDFELIITNDCSTDTTDAIINDIIKSNPNGYKIKYYNQKSNLGMMRNFQFALDQSSSKYIALCEGDDYWIDSDKLQNQVDFLNSNSDYAICFHQVSVDDNGIIAKDTITPKVASTTTIMDLAKGNYIHTPSVMYRNNLISKFPDYFQKTPVGDYFLLMLNAKYGKIKYIDKTMAVYRVHDTSYWSSKNQIDREKIWIDFIENIKENFDSKVQMILEKQIKRMGHKKPNTFGSIILNLKKIFKS